MEASRSVCTSLSWAGLVRALQAGKRALQLLHQVRQAHAHLGEALADGDGLLPAGGVAAGAAVQLVLGAELPHLPERRRDLLLRGLRQHHRLLARNPATGRRRRTRRAPPASRAPAWTPFMLVDVVGEDLLAREDAEVVHHLRAVDAALAEQHVQHARLALAVGQLAEARAGPGPCPRSPARCSARCPRRFPPCAAARRRWGWTGPGRPAGPSKRRRAPRPRVDIPPPRTSPGAPRR